MSVLVADSAHKWHISVSSDGGKERGKVKVRPWVSVTSHDPNMHFLNKVTQGVLTYIISHPGINLVGQCSTRPHTIKLSCIISPIIMTEFTTTSFQGHHTLAESQRTFTGRVQKSEFLNKLIFHFFRVSRVWKQLTVLSCTHY